jgi:hypothetical protein
MSVRRWFFVRMDFEFMVLPPFGTVEWTKKMRPVQAENVILNKKKWDDSVSHPISHRSVRRPLADNPWAYRRSCDDNKQRRYAIHLGHPQPKPDIASKPKTAEAVSNSRNRAFSSASKTTFS